jgi:hypothetical protein
MNSSLMLSLMALGRGSAVSATGGGITSVGVSRDEFERAVTTARDEIQQGIDRESALER